MFVVGGIHEGHEHARKYTYERMGEVYRHLSPEVLCVEALQRSLDDRSDRGIPYDFARHVLPQARQDGIPIVGIDWWDDRRGEQWKRLQSQAWADPSIGPEMKLVGGAFDLLDQYFQEKDFAEINAPEITALWAAKSDFKYKVLRAHPLYAAIAEFEDERNHHMLEAVLRTVQQHPRARILVGVGIDHKYFLERELKSRGVDVLQVGEVMRRWWKP